MIELTDEIYLSWVCFIIRNRRVGVWTVEPAGRAPAATDVASQCIDRSGWRTAAASQRPFIAHQLNWTELDSAELDSELDFRASVVLCDFHSMWKLGTAIRPSICHLSRKMKKINNSCCHRYSKWLSIQRCYRFTIISQLISNVNWNCDIWEMTKHA